MKFYKFSVFLVGLTVLFGPVPVEAKPNLTALVKKIRPAVVTVVTYDINHEVSGIGTGFFISDQGELITNYHVLAGKFSAEIKMHNGKRYPVEAVLAQNKYLDLIKLKVAIPADVLRWAPTAEQIPEIAEHVLVVGSPMGLEQTVSEGIISAVRELPYVGRFFQLSAPISPGSSGSPVVNMNGLVVGVVTFQFIKGQNLNFAVGVKGLKKLMPLANAPTISEWTYAISKIKHRLAEQLCKKGFEFSVRGEPKKALQYYKDATLKDPNNVIAWNGLGHCYAGLDQPEEAIATYKQAIRANIDNAELHVSLGNYYNKLGKLQDAVIAYKEAIRLNPDASTAHFRIGLAYAKMGHHEDAIRAHRQVLRINPQNADAHYNIGVTYSKTGDLQSALGAYQQAVRLNPNHFLAHNNMGIIYGELGQLNEGIQSFKEAIRINPDDGRAHFNIGSVFLRRGDKVAALDEYKILKRIDADKAAALFKLIYK